MAQPLINIISVNRNKISDELGMNQAVITIQFDQDVQAYKAMLNGVDHTTGTLVHSGTTASANTNVDIVIDWNEISEGQNRINIYGQGLDGTWTTYNQEDITNSIYLLYMDGVDDYISTPKIQHSSVEIDMCIQHKSSAYYLYDTRTQSAGGINSYLYWHNDYNYYSGTQVNNKVDGVSKTINTNFIPRGKRTTLRCTYSTGTSHLEDIFIFCRYTQIEFAKGVIYSIKFYDGDTLVAHYDMSTGTIQDQTGNGNHATLTGGTWLEIAVNNPKTDNNFGQSNHMQYMYGE